MATLPPGFQIEQQAPQQVAPQPALQPVQQPVQQPVIEQPTAAATLPEGFVIESQPTIPQAAPIQPQAGDFVTEGALTFTPGPGPTRVPERVPTRAELELPELGQGGLLAGEDTAKVAAIAPVLLTTTNPQ